MTNARWFRLAAGLTALAFLLCALAVVLVDPFQIYRPATRFLPPIDNTTQVYANAGVARSYEYDSAIVGTSVTENFRPSYMDERLSGRFIKLCTAAGTARNHALLLDLAFRTHGMRRVVYGLDIYSFVGEPDKTGSEVPLYLYNDCLLDDVQYWLNRSVLFSFVPRCLAAWGGRQDDGIRDSMYCWAGRDRYGKVALYSASFTPPEAAQPEDRYLENARENLKRHLIPFIEAHPETQFDVFFPPYSAAEWATMESRGTLPALLPLRALAYDALAAFPNVSVYDFSAREEWVLDLRNYKDTTHYGQWINDAITDCIASGDGRVESRADLDEATARLAAWADAQIEAGGWIW